jgi:hypothetical protein
MREEKAMKYVTSIINHSVEGKPAQGAIRRSGASARKLREGVGFQIAKL